MCAPLKVHGGRGGHSQKLGNDVLTAAALESGVASECAEERGTESTDIGGRAPRSQYLGLR